METKDVLFKLRTEKGISQDELAKKGVCNAADRDE